jgi:hypothetical protein
VDRFEDTLLIPDQVFFALTDRTGALQNCMSLIPKAQRGPESGSMIPLTCLFSIIWRREWDSNSYRCCGICNLQILQLAAWA